MSTEISALLDEIQTIHPALRTDTIRGLVSVGESALALEVLCDNLYDDSLVLPIPTVARLKALARQLGVHEKYLNGLPTAV